MATIRKLAKKKRRNRIIYQSEAIYYCHDGTGNHYHDYAAFETYPNDYPWEDLPQKLIDLADSSPESLRTVEGTGYIKHYPGTGSWAPNQRNREFFSYAGNKVRQLKRIQSADYSFERKFIDIYQFGQVAKIDRIELIEPVVRFEANYYLSDGQNEHIIGLKLGDEKANCVWDQELITDGGNLFIVTAPEGEDINFEKNANYQYLDGSIQSNRTVLSIGNCFLTNYSAKGEVGSPATATFTMEGANIKGDVAYDQINIPSINFKSDRLLPQVEAELPIPEIKITRNDGTVSFTGGNYLFGETVSISAEGSKETSSSIRSYLFDIPEPGHLQRIDTAAGEITMPLDEQNLGQLSTTLNLKLTDSFYGTSTSGVPINLT
tara:strand:+ start:17629 stop:18759 length:1131 start_codon:yes stop_codon:yes gene_type:complete